MRVRVVHLLAAVLVLAVACTSRVEPGRAAAAASPTSSAPSAGGGPGTSASAGSGTGPVADAGSSAWPVSARDVRLVRSGDAELALQFELSNESSDEVQAADLGVDPVSQLVMLVDLPRGTGYAPSSGERFSASVAEDVPAGGAATITVMFPAPPAETTSMLVVIDTMVPVEVPVRPQGSPELRDDPVLHAVAAEPDRVAPLRCRTGPGGAATGVPTRYRLPADVLFEFGKAALTPAATATISELAGEITVESGILVVEGHTDAIGQDPANQALSERRAAAVRDALTAQLGSAFEYRAAGFGESRPVAPNTRPDGSDDPDGRAQNRRVELTIEAPPDALPNAAPPPDTGLTGSGLSATVRSVRTIAGFALAQVELHNTSGQDVHLSYVNDNYEDRPPAQGELSLTDAAGARHTPCAFDPPTYFDLVANAYATFVRFGTGAIPPGATVVMWALLAAPPADTRSIEVGIGGYAEPLTAPVTAG